MERSQLASPTAHFSSSRFTKDRAEEIPSNPFFGQQFLVQPAAAAGGRRRKDPPASRQATGNNDLLRCTTNVDLPELKPGNSGPAHATTLLRHDPFSILAIESALHHLAGGSACGGFVESRGEYYSDCIILQRIECMESQAQVVVTCRPCQAGISSYQLMPSIYPYCNSPASGLLLFLRQNLQSHPPPPPSLSLFSKSSRQRCSYCLQLGVSGRDNHLKHLCSLPLLLLSTL